VVTENIQNYPIFCYFIPLHYFHMLCSFAFDFRLWKCCVFWVSWPCFHNLCFPSNTIRAFSWRSERFFQCWRMNSELGICEPQDPIGNQSEHIILSIGLAHFEKNWNISETILIDCEPKAQKFSYFYCPLTWMLSKQCYMNPEVICISWLLI